MNLDELERLREEETRLQGLAWKDDFYFDELRRAAGRLNNAFRNAAPELIAMARRYQWLRSCRDDSFYRCHEKDGYGGQVLKYGVDLDAAIDAAMQEQKP